MKTYLTKFLAFNSLAIALGTLITAPLSGQVNNDNRVNFRVETVSFSYNDCGGSVFGNLGFTADLPLTFGINDECISYNPLPNNPPTLPITFSDSEKIISKINSSSSSTYGLELAAWGNNPIIEDSPCTFDRVETDLFVYTAVDTDHCLREERVYRDKKYGQSGEWHNFSENVGPNTINFRQSWRYNKGDSGSSALDFGTISSGNARNHFNWNNSLNVPGSSNPLGYTNQFDGIANLNTSTDVVYKFRLSSSSPNYQVIISTNYTTNTFDTEIHLLNSARTAVLASNDDIGGGNLNSIITTTLSPGTYYIVVEGASSSTSEGFFGVGLSAQAITPTPGSIANPNPSVFCSGATLPSISSFAGNTTPPSNAPISYKWYKRIGASPNPFASISGATGAILTSAQAGTMPGEEVSFKRKTILGNAESVFTNTVTLTTTDLIGVIRLASNSPLCSGTDGEFYLESENGSTDAGVVISYTLNGSAGTATLDGTGKATITDAALTATSTITLSSADDSGCTVSLTDTETIEIFSTPIVLGCGLSISGDNSSGSTVANCYAGTYNGNPYPRHDAPGKEDIYQIQVLGNSQNVRISLTDLTDDLDLILVSSCDIKNFIEASLNFDDDDELIDINLAPGTYYVIVDANDLTKTSSYTISLESCGVAPICDNIIDVACFETLTSQNNSTLYYIDCLFGSYNSNVYKIEPLNSGTMNFNVTNSTTTQQLYLYDQFCDAGACNNIASSSTGINPSLSFSVVGGTCYYLEVYGSSSPGTYDIEFDCPVTCPCTTDVDYVEVVDNGAICLEPNPQNPPTIGTYTIQPGLGANATPFGIVTYSLNGGANQTVTLDAAGMATISDTPTAAANPASTIVLSKISKTVGGQLCSIELDAGAQFNANSFPTFSVVFSNGPNCAGSDVGLYTINASSSTSNPTPYANITYEISFNGQSPAMPTITGTLKLDESGTGEIAIPPTQAATPSSFFNLISTEINGCVVTLGGAGSITTIDPASPVTITANPTFCPGADAVFTVTGTPTNVVEYDDTNFGSLPNGTGDPNTKYVQLDAAGEATITVPNPTGDVRIDIYTVLIDRFNNNDNSYGFCELFYEFGDVFAESERTEIGIIEIDNANLDICETEQTYWDLFGSNGPTPNGTVSYTLNGVSGTHITGDVIMGTIYDNNPTPGTSTLTLNSISSNGCVVNLTSSLTKNVVEQYQPVIVTSNEEICDGETAIYEITPAPGATPNPAGTIVVYTFDEVSYPTIALDGNGEATISLSNQTTNSTMTLADISEQGMPCFLQLNGAASVEVVPFASDVMVSVVSDICSDGLAEFRIDPVSTPSPQAGVAYTLDGAIDTIFLDDSGIASIYVADASGEANDHTLVLTSIFYRDCDLPLNITETLTCDMPCYEYQTRNYLEEEVVVHQVEGYIESISTICAPSGGGTADVSYLAGDFVSLDPGFTVEPGCIFLADIDPCIAECPCGLVTSPTGSADVPGGDVLRWKVNEDATCVIDLESDQGNANADIEMDVTGYLSGSSGPALADLSMRIPGSSDRVELIDVVISTGLSTVQLGIYTADNGGAYLVQINLDYVGVILKGTLYLTPWCITPPPASCATLARTAQGEAPTETLKFILTEDPYCVIGIPNAPTGAEENIKVQVNGFVGPTGSVEDEVDVDVTFTSPIGGGAATHNVTLTSGVGFTSIPTFTYTARNGAIYDIDVDLEYNYRPAGIEADLVETIIFVTPQ